MSWSTTKKHLYLETDTNFWDLTGKVTSAFLRRTSTYVEREMIGRDYMWIAPTRLSASMDISGILIDEPDPVLVAIMNTRGQEVRIMEWHSDGKYFAVGTFILLENSLIADGGIWVLNGNAVLKDGAGLLEGWTVDEDTPNWAESARGYELRHSGKVVDVINTEFVMLINDMAGGVDIGANHGMGVAFQEDSTNDQWRMDFNTPPSFDTNTGKQSFIKRGKLVAVSDFSVPKVNAVGELYFYRDDSGGGAYPIAASPNILGYAIAGRLS